MQNYTRVIKMNGNGSEQIGVRSEQRFLTIFNYTNYLIHIVRGYDNNTSNIIYSVPPLSAFTYPTPAAEITLSWVGTGADEFTLVLSEENLGLNQSLTGGESVITLAGNDIAGNTIEGNSVEGNETNGNEITGNILSGNTFAGVSMEGTTVAGVTVNGISFDGISFDGISMEGISAQNLDISDFVLADYLESEDSSPSIRIGISEARNKVSVSRNIISGNQVGEDLTFSFANPELANAQKVSADIALPAQPLTEYELVCYNPSIETDLTVKLLSKETALGGADRYALLTSFSIPKTQAISGTTINSHIRLFHGAFNGQALQVILSNDSAIATTPFDAIIRLREVI